MKVLYISNRLNAGDGSSVHGREFIKAVIALGHEVKTFPALEEARYEENYSKEKKRGFFETIKKINFKNINYSIKNKSVYYRDISNAVEGYLKSRNNSKAVKKIIDEYVPDVIVYRAVMYDFIPNIIRKKTCSKMIAEVNSIKLLEQKINNMKASTWISKRSEMLTYEVSDAIVVVSNAIKNYLVDAGAKQPVAVASNGVDLSVFKPDFQLKKDLKLRYNLENKVVIGYVGSYKKWHGLDNSLLVLKQLVGKKFPVQFVVIGSGPEEKRLDKMAAELGLDAHITKIQSLPHHEIPFYVNIIDIALMTYPQIDNFYFSPLKMYEYLAAGIPVVASRLGQIEEVLDGNEMGELVAPGDIDDFTEVIGQLVTDQNYRGRLGGNARLWAEKHCSWQVNAEKVLAAADFC